MTPSLLNTYSLTNFNKRSLCYSQPVSNLCASRGPPGRALLRLDHRYMTFSDLKAIILSEVNHMLFTSNKLLSIFHSGYILRENVFGKRQLSYSSADGTSQAKLEAEQILYGHLSQVLVNCQQSTSTWRWGTTTPKYRWDGGYSTTPRPSWRYPHYWTTRRPWRPIVYPTNSIRPRNYTYWYPGYRTSTDRPRNYNYRNSTSRPSTTSDGWIPMNTTTDGWIPRNTTTTWNPYLEECVEAMIFKEPWRRSLSGVTFFGQEKCDTTELTARGRPWFRFGGQAGTKLRSTCPEKRPACGASVAFWSDAKLPEEIGVKSRYHAYISKPSGCNADKRPIEMSVIKCAENSFIYRYDDDGFLCPNSFCGMY